MGRDFKRVEGLFFTCRVVGLNFSRVINCFIVLSSVLQIVLVSGGTKKLI